MNSVRDLIFIVSAMITAIWLITGCTEDKSPVAPEPEPQPAVDHVAPTVEWVEPQGGADLSGTVELAFTAVDSGTVERVRIYRSGFVLGEGGHSCLPENRNISATDDTLYTLEWDTRTVGDDVYILEARAWDEAGNLGISPSLMVRVKNDSVPPPEDRTPPLVVWRSPQPGSEIAGTVELRFDALDNVGIDSLKVYLNGSCPEGFEMTGHPEAEYSILWDTENIEDGVYILEARAWDESGNMGVSPSLLVRVRNNEEPPPEDLTPPDVWWTAPDAGSTLAASVLLQFRAFDEGTVAYVQLYRNGTSPEGARLPGRPDNEYGFWWNTLNDSDGVYIWEARAWDEAGNMGVSPSLLVRVRNNEEPPPEDHTPPVVTWRSPEPGSEVEGVVELRCDVLDDDAVDSVKFYVSGRTSAAWSLPGHPEVGYAVNWETNEFEDGSYHIEIRAQDRSGNIGIAPSVILKVLNNPPPEPRVLWVPDDFETIQDAIWHSEDGDTIMVRSGNYHEQLQMFDKNVSLISESGPEETIIDGTGYYTCAWVTGGQDTNMVVRGFTFSNSTEFPERYQPGCFGIVLGSGASPKILNNIFIVTDGRGIFTEQTASLIRNNLMIDSYGGISIGQSWGDLINNMFIHFSGSAIWNACYRGQPLIPDYNLFWDYNELITGPPSMEWGEHNIDDREPLFEEGSYRLREDSPGIDQGKPDISDLDGTRSDIGVYGGPYSY